MIQYPIKVDPSSPFPIENIPFGIFSINDKSTRHVGTIIGGYVIDVKLLAEHEAFNGTDAADLAAINAAVSSDTLNLLASLPYASRSFVRERIIHLLTEPGSVLFTNSNLNKNAFIHAEKVKMHLPIEVHSFTDFMCSETHLENGNRITGNTMASFFAFPTAYNGRTTSIIPSGDPILRPKGMLRQPIPDGPPAYSFSASTRFDFELEMGVIVSGNIPRGQIITADQATELIFGFVLLNDWSARDIQFAEMTGMGPYNGKAMATTISPWVVFPQALEEAQCELTSKKSRAIMPSHPDHLRHRMADGRVTWNVELQALIANRNGRSTTVCKSNLRDLYWTPGQMLAHMTSSGSGAVAGDLFGSGTVSSPGHTAENPTLGCLFELTDGGKTPLRLEDGREIVWLEDYDEVILTGWATGKGGKRIGFGEARGMLMPTDWLVPDE
ncbi:hypothetical protein BKA56DRAFT_691209 [Ilyonectria sp. MPI-CAGE-AT-0026]|nr:hypothetical protein BKA56DRAFT_691209 [Ilyonectria sp. MPI-CAGE-AT-0026]